MLTSAPDRSGGLDADRLFASLAAHDTIGLAVSGGPDSLGLMALYAAWCGKGRPGRAIVYTVDHGLRPEARAEAEMVCAAAERLGLESRLLIWEGDKPLTGRQAAARRARYRLIGAQMAKDGATALVTAHHRGDQAETVLMRLAHGSGVTGLGAIRAESVIENIVVLRPLLGVGANALAGLAEEAGLTPVSDPSNSDLAYERVRWRAAKPDLERLGLSEHRLALAAGRFQRADDFAATAAREFLDRHAEIDALGVIHVALSHWDSAHAEVGIRALRGMLSCASGGKDIALGPVESLFFDLRDEGMRTLSGAVVQRKGGGLRVFREAGRFSAAPMALAPSQSCLWDGRFSIAAGKMPLVVRPGRDMTRKVFENHMGKALPGPVAALRAAPVVRTAEGALVAIGGHMVADGAEISHLTLTA